MATVERSHALQLAAGTASGHVELLDVATAALSATLPATLQDQKSAASCLAVCSSDNNGIVAGFDSGIASLMDPRSGVTAHRWQAHAKTVTSVAANAHQLVSVAQDRTLKVWDVRKLSSSTAASACVHALSGFEHSFTGCATYQRTGISWQRSKVAILSLQAPFSQRVLLTRLTDASGCEDHAAISGLCVLPCSKLLIVSAADGMLKIVA